MEETWERTHRMLIGWDVPIEMDDNLVLRADVFRPAGSDACPVILAYGPYAKGLTFQEGLPTPGGRWWMVIPTFRRAPRTVTRPGRSATPRSGYRTATPAYALTLAAGDALPAT